MTDFYVDTFFGLNLVLNYLLLAAAGRLAGGGLSRRRCLLGAGLGAGYGVLAVAGPLPFLSHPVCQAGAAVLLLLAAYGQSGQLLKVGGLFLLLSCALGGGLLLLGMKGERMGLREILTAAVLCYGVLSLLLSGQFRHTRAAGERVPLTLYRNGKHLSLPALVDTGNTLRDPLNGQPVVIVEGRTVLPLFPELAELGEEALSRPVECLTQLRERFPGLRVRLLPYRAVGVSCGLLMAVRLDKILCNGRPCPGKLVALSPTPLSEGEGCCALVGGEQKQGG